MERSIPISGFMFHLFSLMIASSLFNHALADVQDSSGLGNITARRVSREARNNYGSHEMFCYMCRSDYDLACRNGVDSDEHDFIRPCGKEEHAEFDKQLKNDPPKHPLPKYENAPRAVGDERQAEPKKKYSCFTSMTSDRLFVLRTCFENSEGKVGEGCTQCRTHNGTHTSRCCSCNKPLCNKEKAGAPHLSPPVVQNLLCTNLLGVLMIGKLFTKAYF